jgi:hypothetical protein
VRDVPPTRVTRQGTIGNAAPGAAPCPTYLRRSRFQRSTSPNDLSSHVGHGLSNLPWRQVTARRAAQWQGVGSGGGTRRCPPPCRRRHAHPPPRSPVDRWWGGKDASMRLGSLWESMPLPAPRSLPHQSAAAPAAAAATRAAAPRKFMCRATGAQGGGQRERHFWVHSAS